jgi:hypothetical protein
MYTQIHIHKSTVIVSPDTLSLNRFKASVRLSSSSHRYSVSSPETTFGVRYDVCNDVWNALNPVESICLQYSLAVVVRTLRVSKILPSRIPAQFTYLGNDCIQIEALPLANE